MRSLVFLLLLFVGIDVTDASEFLCAEFLTEEQTEDDSRRAAKLAKD